MKVHWAFSVTLFDTTDFFFPPQIEGPHMLWLSPPPYSLSLNICMWTYICVYIYKTCACICLYIYIYIKTCICNFLKLGDTKGVYLLSVFYWDQIQRINHTIVKVISFVSFSVFIVVCNHYLCLVQNILITPKGNPVPIKQLNFLLPNCQSFCLWIYLFWIFHVNGILHDGVVIPVGL